jgi:hypothetical protein
MKVKPNPNLALQVALEEINRLQKENIILTARVLELEVSPKKEGEKR